MLKLLDAFCIKNIIILESEFYQTCAVNNSNVSLIERDFVFVFVVWHIESSPHSPTPIYF